MIIRFITGEAIKYMKKPTINRTRAMAVCGNQTTIRNENSYSRWSVKCLKGVEHV